MTEFKRIVIGDLHGRYDSLQKIYDREDPDSVILLGDYFDNRSGITPVDQGKNYDKILKLQKSHNKKKRLKFIKLLGNHDYHYLIDGEKYSGWNIGTKFIAQEKLKKDLDDNKIQIVYIDEVNKTIYSHAGVTDIWLNTECYCQNSLGMINDLSLDYFSFVGFNMFGDDPRNSPIWVRPNSLLKSMYRDNFGKEWTQVVGHTNCKKPIIVGQDNNQWNPDIDTWENAKLWVIDCMPKYYMRETLDDTMKCVKREIVEVECNCCK